MNPQQDSHCPRASSSLKYRPALSTRSKKNCQSFARADGKIQFSVTYWSTQRFEANQKEQQKDSAIVSLAAQRWVPIVMCHQTSCEESLRMPGLPLKEWKKKTCTFFREPLIPKRVTYRYYRWATHIGLFWPIAETFRNSCVAEYHQLPDCQLQRILGNLSMLVQVSYLPQGPWVKPKHLGSGW